MSLKSLLAELQKNYIASIPEKIMSIGSLFSAGNIEDLRTEYHKLKGTGRTYGLPEVTQLGEALEALCDNPTALKTVVPISQALLERIRVSRSQGAALRIEEDADFKVIVELLTRYKLGA